MKVMEGKSNISETKILRNGQSLWSKKHAEELIALWCATSHSQDMGDCGK